MMPEASTIEDYTQAQVAMTVGAGSTFFYEIQKIFFLRKSTFLDPRFKRSKKKKKKAGLASAARAFAKNQSALEEI